jgi:putative SOS response-associated peptidase YedK
LSFCRAAVRPGGSTKVRDDKVLTSSFWRPSFEQRRCLVPASSFCEPHGGAASHLAEAVGRVSLDLGQAGRRQ